jgi:predicted O-methyltransferase YrrM
MGWKFTRDIICPKDAKSLDRYEAYREQYRVKYDLAKRFNPKRILEIGVRAGYSAYAFLSACPYAAYTGIDAENGTHGGEGGPWMWWARKLLGDRNATFIEADSQEMAGIQGTYDFIHIDGDHTTIGLLHDLSICWPAMSESGVILVDDYDYLKPVQQGCDIWNKRPDVRSEYVNSLRGEVLFSTRERS